MITVLRKRICLPCMAVAIALTLGLLVPHVRGADSSPEAEMKQKAIGSAMMEIKTCTKDDTAREMLRRDLAKTILMQQMAMATCSDEKCRMMLSSDPDLMRLVADARALLADSTQVEAMQKQIMSDPKQMQTVIIHALAAGSAASTNTAACPLGSPSKP